MIYFDNAATSGYKPPEVIDAVNYAMKNLSANPGRSGHKLSVAAMRDLTKFICSRQGSLQTDIRNRRI